MNYKINHSYNFKTNAPAVLGEAYSMMKVKAILSAEQAVQHADIGTLHTTLMPLIPGMPENVKDMTFILFETPNGDEVVFALEYIKDDTVEEVKSINIRIDVLDANTSDFNIIRAKLVELGYANIKLSTF